MLKNINNLEEMDTIIDTVESSLFYISTEACGVCKVLKPKIMELFKERFPKVELYYIDSEKSPEIAGQLSIFAIPTVLVYLDKQEFIRESRNISIGELERSFSRPYNMFFDE